VASEQKTFRHLAGHDLETVFNRPAQPQGVVVLAHGRINDLEHPVLKTAAQGAQEAGWAAVRFNFPYRQRGDAQPDSFGLLVEVHRAAAEWALSQLGPGSRRLVMAGKSLGARTAVEAVRQGLEAAGLLFLGYPLHPPGQVQDLRDQPLLGLDRPLLFVQGQADDLCRLDLLESVLARLQPRPELEVVPQADHGFARPGGGADPSPEVLAQIKQAVAQWLAGLK